MKHRERRDFVAYGCSLRSRDIRKTRSRLALFLSFAVLVWVSGNSRGAQPDELTAVTNRFVATRPTVVLDYDASYEFLFFEFKNVAKATLTATEGRWQSAVSNDWIPACLLTFRVHATDSGKDHKDSDVKLDKRTVSVATMPDLRLITYVKINDEFIKPLFRKGRRMKYVESYDFEKGGLNYYRRDLASGATETNLVNGADLSAQSTEVADVLKSLYAAYCVQKGRDESKLGPRVHFNVEGTVRTFELYARKGKTSVPILRKPVDALNCHVRRADGDEDRNEGFAMWTIPFKVLAEGTNDKELKAVAETSIEWSMVPLSGRYELFLGGINCTVTNVAVRLGETNSTVAR